MAIDESNQYVLGVDVGFSDNRLSTGLCLLSWNDTEINIKATQCSSVLNDQEVKIRNIVEGRTLSSVAIDGPLTYNFEKVNYYRSAEALLSRGCLQKRGKPGQTNSPIGQKLHDRATELAKFIAESLDVQEATHYQPIHTKSIVEAFPNMFLAALIDERLLPLPLHHDASDRYWEKAAELGIFDRMLRELLPGRELLDNLGNVTNHDERAAIACALTALVVAIGKPVGVGDPIGGDIILPPRKLWGLDNGGAAWMGKVLLANLASIRAKPGNCHHHDKSRIYNGHGQLEPELTHLVCDIARIPSFTTYEARLKPFIDEYCSKLFTLTNEPANVSVTCIPDNNLILEWQGNRQDIPPIALTAHLDKINHLGTLDIKKLSVAIEGDEIVGQLDDAVGVALCLHILSECIHIEDCPPIMLLLSEMEEKGNYPDSNFLRNNGQGYELSPGAHRIADYLINKKKLPQAVITFDTSAVFEKTGGIAVYPAFWDMEGSSTEQQSSQLLSRTDDLVNRLRTINPDIHLANGSNDYVTYGSRFNEQQGNDIPSIAIEPAIWPIHAIGERVKIENIRGVADMVLKLIKQWPITATVPKPYDHHNKAGNQGDVVKHVALLAAAEALMQGKRDAFSYADTFAGYAYNPIRSSGEWQNGIGIYAEKHTTPKHQALSFWYSLWQCAYGLPGSVYPGSSTFIRKLCMKHDLKPQLSLWDTSPAVVSQLRQAYSDTEAAIFDRSATLADLNSNKPDLLLIDPPDLSLVEESLGFCDKSDAVIIWLAILHKDGKETQQSQDAYAACQRRGYEIISVTWEDSSSMRGCRLICKLPSVALSELKSAVQELSALLEYQVA